MMASPKKYPSAAAKQAAYRQRCKVQRQAELASNGIFAIPPTPGHRRWNAMKRQAANLIEQVASEMETYYDQKSENWQDSERGEVFADAMESIAEIVDALRELEA